MIVVYGCDVWECLRMVMIMIIMMITIMLYDCDVLLWCMMIMGDNYDDDADDVWLGCMMMMMYDCDVWW